MTAYDLEVFVEEGLRLAKDRGYYPTIFERMRSETTTISAMKRLVVSGEIQSGFKKLKKIGLIEYSIEAGILKFPDHFTKDEIECAEFRLRQLS